MKQDNSPAKTETLRISKTGLGTRAINDQESGPLKEQPYLFMYNLWYESLNIPGTKGGPGGRDQTLTVN